MSAVNQTSSSSSLLSSRPIQSTLHADKNHEIHEKAIDILQHLGKTIGSALRTSPISLSTHLNKLQIAPLSEKDLYALSHLSWQSNATHQSLNQSLFDNDLIKKLDATHQDFLIALINKPYYYEFCLLDVLIMEIMTTCESLKTAHTEDIIEKLLTQVTSLYYNINNIDKQSSQSNLLKNIVDSFSCFQQKLSPLIENHKIEQKHLEYLMNILKQVTVPIAVKTSPLNSTPPSNNTEALQLDTETLQLAVFLCHHRCAAYKECNQTPITNLEELTSVFNFFILFLKYPTKFNNEFLSSHKNLEQKISKLPLAKTAQELFTLCSTIQTILPNKFKIHEEYQSEPQKLQDIVLLRENYFVWTGVIMRYLNSSILPIEFLENSIIILSSYLSFSKRFSETPKFNLPTTTLSPNPAYNQKIADVITKINQLCKDLNQYQPGPKALQKLCVASINRQVPVTIEDFNAIEDKLSNTIQETLKNIIAQIDGNQILKTNQDPPSFVQDNENSNCIRNLIAICPQIYRDCHSTHNNTKLTQLLQEIHKKTLELVDLLCKPQSENAPPLYDSDQLQTYLQDFFMNALQRTFYGYILKDMLDMLVHEKTFNILAADVFPTELIDLLQIELPKYPTSLPTLAEKELTSSITHLKLNEPLPSTSLLSTSPEESSLSDLSNMDDPTPLNSPDTSYTNTPSTLSRSHEPATLPQTSSSNPNTTSENLTDEQSDLLKEIIQEKKARKVITILKKLGFNEPDTKSNSGGHTQYILPTGTSHKVTVSGQGKEKEIPLGTRRSIQKQATEALLAKNALLPSSPSSKPKETHRSAKN